MDSTAGAGLFKRRSGGTPAVCSRSAELSLVRASLQGVWTPCSAVAALAAPTQLRPGVLSSGWFALGS